MDLNIDWRVKFENMKKENRVYKSPEFLTFYKNKSTKVINFNNNLKFVKLDNGFYNDSLQRYLGKNEGFLSVNFLNRNLKESFTLTINGHDFVFSNRQMLSIYYNTENIYILKNYILISGFNFFDVDEFTITAPLGSDLELDYVKEYTETIPINIFSMTESLLKKVDDLMPDFDINRNDYQFDAYTINYKPGTLDNYFPIIEPEILDYYLGMKGSYKDISLIEKANIFESITFKDENTKYTNFLNYFFNYNIDNYYDIMEVFNTNYNLYQKFKNDFKCVITEDIDNYLRVNWEEVSLDRCMNFELDGNNVTGLYFVDNVIDNDIYLSLNGYYVDNLINRRIEILDDIKLYLEYLQEIKGFDFREVTLKINNDRNFKISNSESFKIPGDEINSSSLKLEGSSKECYIDYDISLDLNDEQSVIDFKDNLEALNKILDERMPFFLNKYFENLSSKMVSEYIINPDVEFDIDAELDVEDIYQQNNLENYEIESELDYTEVYDFKKSNSEELSIFSDGSYNPYNMKIGIDVQMVGNNDLNTSGLVDNVNEDVLIYGSNDYDDYNYNDLVIGKTCLDRSKNLIVEVFCGMSAHFSLKLESKRDVLYTKKYENKPFYKNRVFQITDLNTFRYVDNTENIFSREDAEDYIDNSEEPQGIYLYSGEWYRKNGYKNQGETWKIGGVDMIIEDKNYVMNLKEQYFVGKGDNQIVVRDYFTKE